MEIFFDNSKLQRRCSELAALKKTYGDDCAGRIARRLQQLRSVDCLDDMRSLPGRCHELVGDRRGSFSLDLVHPLRLVFRPGDDPPALKTDGGIDWAGVKVVIVTGIEDTHEN